MCFTFFACCSCICRDLEIGLYFLPCTFGFLWRGLFSDLPFFMTYFFFGVGPCRIMSLPSPGLPCIHFVALLAFPTIPLYYSCYNVVWLNPARPLWTCCLFPSQWLSAFTGPFLTLFAGSYVPFPSWASLAYLFSFGFLGPFSILLSHGSFLHTTYKFASSLFSDPFKPVCFLRIHFMSSWAIHSCHLGSMAFSCLLTLVCPCCWAFSLIGLVKMSLNTYQLCLNK